jgi:DNA-binding IscR family transcriptional regulator
LPGGRNSLPAEVERKARAVPGVNERQAGTDFDPPWSKTACRKPPSWRWASKTSFPSRGCTQMKLSANEEYGVRCLVRIAYAGPAAASPFPKSARRKASRRPTPPRFCACCARAVSSKRARQRWRLHAGAPGRKIVIGDVIDALGGRLFESDFCDSHTGQAAICTRSVDCSVRSLWRAVQVAVDQVLGKATLRDLLQNEEEMNSWVRTIPSRMTETITRVPRIQAFP